MAEVVFILVIILWYGFSLYVSEIAGKKSRLGVEYLFFLSVLFSPFIGYLIVIISKKPGTQNTIAVEEG